MPDKPTGNNTESLFGNDEQAEASEEPGEEINGKMPKKRRTRNHELHGADSRGVIHADQAS